MAIKDGKYKATEEEQVMKAVRATVTNQRKKNSKFIFFTQSILKSMNNEKIIRIVRVNTFMYVNKLGGGGVG